MRKKILAVDKDQRILEEVKDALSSSEYEIISTTSGKDALDAVESQRPNCLIIAIDMDDIDGLEIISTVHKMGIKMPIIVLTSRSDNETAEMIKAWYKPEFYMTKPLRKEELVRNLRSIFEKPSQWGFIPTVSAEQSQSILKAICDYTHESISLLDKELNIIWINKVLENKGFRLDWIIGHKSYRVFDNKDSPDTSHPTLKAINSKEVQFIKEKGQDGKTYKVISIPILDSNREIVYIVEMSEEVIV